MKRVVLLPFFSRVVRALLYLPLELASEASPSVALPAGKLAVPSLQIYAQESILSSARTLLR